MLSLLASLSITILSLARAVVRIRAQPAIVGGILFLGYSRLFLSAHLLMDGGLFPGGGCYE